MAGRFRMPRRAMKKWSLAFLREDARRGNPFSGANGRRAELALGRRHHRRAARHGRRYPAPPRRAPASIPPASRSRSTPGNEPSDPNRDAARSSPAPGLAAHDTDALTYTREPTGAPDGIL